MRYTPLKRILSCVCFTFIAMAAVPAAAAPGQVNQVNIYSPSLRLLFISLISDALEAAAADSAVKVQRLYADDDFDRQKAMLAAEQKSGTAHVVRVVDASRAGELVKIAKDHNSVITFISVGPKDPAVLDGYENAWFVASNSAQTGILQSELILEYLHRHPDYDRNGNGTLDILLFRGPKENYDTKTRTAENIKALDASGISYRIVDDVYADWYYERAFQHTQSVIQDKRYGKFDLVISNNDDMALGYIDAVEGSQEYEAGSIDLLPVFGIDGMSDAQAAVRRGALTGTVSQDIATIGKVALEISLGHTDPAHLSEVAGVEVKGRRILISNAKLTKENIKAKRPGSPQS